MMPSDQNVLADAVMKKLWAEWFEHYQTAYRGAGVGISAADQMAFYEIAQPLLRSLSTRPVNLITALEETRDRMKAEVRYGEPCIRIDAEKLSIVGANPDCIYMTMKDLIEVVRTTL